MDYLEKYELWVRRVENEKLGAELDAIKGDDAEKRARFSGELEFGTAGLRGKLGAGTDMMNLYTVGRATQGLADYINECFGGGCVAVSYDSRNMSREFAQRTAGVLAANGIEAHIFDRLMPTPLLSFAVRELRAKAGVMITASHNPAAYNGYKAYGSDGCQMTSEAANAVYSRIEKVDTFDGVKLVDFREGVESGAIKYISDRLVERYYIEVLKQRVNPGVCEYYPLGVVYSPLNGTGLEPVTRIFSELSVGDVHIVERQREPDGDFPTCPYPNPETREALSLGLELCNEVKPDIFIATDPDADRVGVAVKEHGGSYRILTGNEVGALLLDYIIASRAKNGTMPKAPVAVKSIVSTKLADDIAADAGVEMRNVLTGFKYIGEQVLLLEQKGEAERFIFGFEESCGYLSGGYVRDKDAVLAAMLLCEMTSFYKSKGKMVVDALTELYEKYGFYLNRVLNFEFAGVDGPDNMKKVMARLRSERIDTIGGFAVTSVTDYLSGKRKSLTLGGESETGLPPSDVLEYVLENGAAVIVRPSGTEPKVKLYLSVKEKTFDESERLAEELGAEAKKLLGL